MEAGLPHTVLPMLATVGTVPGGPGWVFEWKWDGVRAIVAAAPGAVRAISRNDRDITGGYPELTVLGELVDQPVLLDGELVAMDEAGRPSFEVLQARMHVRGPSPQLMAATPVYFHVFDVLHLGGTDLYGLGYEDRRELLTSLELADGPIRTPDFLTGIPGADLLRLAGEHGLEGVVAKRLGSRYEPGRRVHSWIKTPLRHTQDVVVGGWTPGLGRRASTFGALLLGVYRDGGLHYAGHVGTGFTDRTLRELHGLLLARELPASPFAEPVPPQYARGARWVVPDLVGEVEHRQWTGDHRLRHPSWRGLRPDRDPTDVRATQLTRMPPGAGPSG